VLIGDTLRALKYTRSHAFCGKDRNAEITSLFALRSLQEESREFEGLGGWRVSLIRGEMVQVDLAMSYGFGSGVALTAHRQLRQSKSRVMNRYGMSSVSSPGAITSNAGPSR
jgi:hypothetical protein